MTKSTFAKTKAQIKSYQYYIFWGACTVAVMAGQIFVGAGYQSMSQSVNDLTEMIEIKKHPWFLGCQFHPEFTSNPRDGHPIFNDFIAKAIKIKR